MSTTNHGTPSPERPVAAPFFAWLRRLGVVRGDRWIAGVCGGLAARLGVDPLLIRGAAVVLALFGFPAIIAYAIAWLLLPDTDDEIVLERVLRHGWSPSLVVIVVIVIFALTPFAGGVWWATGHLPPFDLVPYGITSTFHALQGIAMLALLVWLAVVIVRFARNHRWGSDAAPRTPPADRASASADSEVPSAPAEASASTDWRARQAEWQARMAADRQRIREERADEAHRRATERIAAWEDERRARAASHPHASGWFVTLTLGLALVVGALSAAFAPTWFGVDGLGGTIGLSAALVVIGLAMVVAGLGRRHATALGWVAALVVLLLLFAVIGETQPFAHGYDVHIGGYQVFQLPWTPGQLGQGPVGSDVPGT